MSTQIDLTIGGMTCASCAGRVERKLNKLDGVVATVNLATEKAHVTYPAELDPAALVAEVEAAGYTATLPTPDPPPATDPTRPLRNRFLVVAALAVPVVVLSMVTALQFPGWEWWTRSSRSAPSPRWAGRSSRSCAARA
jgi:Cu+-exporting ATPase